MATKKEQNKKRAALKRIPEAARRARNARKESCTDLLMTSAFMVDIQCENKRADPCVSPVPGFK